MSIIKELTTPSSFDRDWYGYLTNQAAHALSGCVVVGLICAITFLLKGDMPYKVNVFWGVAVSYAAKELIWDRWNGLDTVEDFLFVVAYGAGGTLITFSQVSNYTAQIQFEIFEFLFVLFLFFSHLLIGIFIRKREV